MHMIWNLFLLIIGFVMLVKGADWFVEGASSVAKRLGVSQLVIGLTIVAMGTSMPEAAVSITAAIKGNAGITIGNIVGSNIMNVLVILGITALICRVAIQKSTLKYEIPFMVLISIVLLIFGITGAKITLIEGIALWGLFILYLVYLFIMSKKGVSEEDGDIADYAVWLCIIMIIGGGALVVLGSDFVVDGASYVAKSFGMSDRVIGLTIVAFGTSLPELVTSVTAARKGNAGIAIGNIVGSCVFNILFVVGSTALVRSVPFESKFVIDTLIAAAAGVVLWLGTVRHRELRRPCGIFMLLCYAVYYVYLFGFK